MTYIVDTHSLVWFLEGDPRLSAPARTGLADPSVQLVVPTIVLAEIAFLYAKHRVTVDVPSVLAHVASATNCIVYPLDELVVERLPTTLDIHDAIIVATGIVYRDVLGEAVAVITKDTDITASGLLTVIW